jgi:spore maturation protein CgeB
MDTYKPVISFFGSSLVSTYWNRAATYYRGITKYLNKLGCKITFYEPDAFNRQKHVDLPDPEWVRVVVYENSQAGAEWAVQEASRSDILIKASGVGVFDAYLEKVIPEVKKPHQMVIFWDVDAPATLQAIFKDPDSSLRSLIPGYDYIFTSGGGERLIKAYKSLNARECIPVYNALDPETHFNVPVNPKFKCDLAFLGNHSTDREEKVREFFINVAEELPAKKFILGGSGWHGSKFPPNIVYTGHVYAHEHNDFNSSPRCILNLSRDSRGDYGFSPSSRIFEAAGAGACIITDYREGIEKFFTPSSEIHVAGKGSDVVSLLQKLDDQETVKTGMAALSKVISEHNYEKRALQVSKLLFEQETFALSL